MKRYLIHHEGDYARVVSERSPLLLAARLLDKPVIDLGERFVSLKDPIERIERNICIDLSVVFENFLIVLPPNINRITPEIKCGIYQVCETISKYLKR